MRIYKGVIDTSPRDDALVVGINSRWFFEEVSVGGKQLVQDQLIPIACFLIALLPKSCVLLKIMKKTFSMPLKG